MCVCLSGEAPNVADLGKSLYPSHKWNFLVFMASGDITTVSLSKKFKKPRIPLSNSRPVGNWDAQL